MFQRTGYLYSGNSANLADVIDANNLIAVNTSCFALGSDSVAGACSGNTGITAGAGTLAFFFPGGSYKSQITAVNKYLDGDVWFAGLEGLKFTSVGLLPEE